MAKYSYPRVDISTKALKHSSIAPGAEDTTVLFMPLKTEKGPDYQVTPVHSLSEFVQTFGSLEYVYAENRQAALNLNNWLINGGTVYACRLPAAADTETVTVTEAVVDASTGETLTPAVTEEITLDKAYGAKCVKSTAASVDGNEFKFVAAFNGEYYNGLVITLSALGNRYLDSADPLFNITIEKGPVVVERFYRITKDSLKETLENSNYIRVNEAEVTFGEDDYILGENKKEAKIIINGAREIDSDINTLVKAFYTTSNEAGAKNAYTVLGNRLETPIDLILDAGYKPDVKVAMWNFVNPGTDSENARPDIVLILDNYYWDPDAEEMKDATAEADYDLPFGTNVAVYDQYFKVNCIFEDGKEIDVTPSYFLSKLIAYNDNQYGVQWATAGIRRGVLDDVTWINKNPYPSEKQQLFEDRINYVEKTSREYAFMSQRTHDGSSDAAYTALSFLNNVRALYKMQRELERLGRDYLYEFNDSVTLANLSNVLNRYMTQWVSNRTLASAVVDVKKSSYSDEAVDITMTIRFTGTIEVISIDITIE